MKWPNENGKPITVGKLTNETLVADTQRLIDAIRRYEDDRMYANVQGSESSVKFVRNRLKPLKFTGHIKKMVEECAKRGLPINTDR